MSDQETSQTPAPAKASPNRGRLFLMFGGAVVAIALVWGGYELLFGGKTVSTDNAYVDASSATITAQIAAPVAQVDIYDTKPVKKGDVLLTLDGRVVADAGGLLRLLGADAIDRPLTAKILRGGRIVEASVTPTRRAAATSPR